MSKKIEELMAAYSAAVVGGDAALQAAIMAEITALATPRTVVKNSSIKAPTVKIEKGILYWNGSRKEHKTASQFLAEVLALAPAMGLCALHLDGERSEREVTFKGWGSKADTVETHVFRGALDCGKVGNDCYDTLQERYTMAVDAIISAAEKLFDVSTAGDINTAANAANAAVLATEDAVSKVAGVAVATSHLR